MNAKSRIRIRKELVDAARKGTPWDLGNEVLYGLCRRHPKHTDSNEIIAKLWLIGRAYAAAIERRRKRTEFSGDPFYTDHVGPKLRKLKIDDWLAPLAGEEDVTWTNLETVLVCHQRLTDAFQRLTGLDKRSLASKYLHFHFRQLFFIYDTRAEKALRTLRMDPVRSWEGSQPADRTYAAFCRKCLTLRDAIETDHHIRLTPRQLDNLLLEFGRAAARRIERRSSRRTAPLAPEPNRPVDRSCA